MKTLLAFLTGLAVGFVAGHQSYLAPAEHAYTVDRDSDEYGCQF